MNDVINAHDLGVAGGYIIEAAMQQNIDRLKDENAKLRELVHDMWFWGYCGHMDSESQEWQMKHIDGVLDRMRKLGIRDGGF